MATSPTTPGSSEQLAGKRRTLLAVLGVLGVVLAAFLAYFGYTLYQGTWTSTDTAGTGGFAALGVVSMLVARNLGVINAQLKAADKDAR